MSIRFTPLGVPISSSFAYSASAALSVTITPITASYVDHALNLTGSAGSPAITTQSLDLVFIASSPTPTPSLTSTVTPTPSPTPSFTPSPTPTPTPSPTT